MSRRVLTGIFLAILSIGMFSPLPGSAASSDVCKIPKGGDADGNGWGDPGVQVICNYTALYAYDANDDYYWDLGDGRIQGTVTSVDALDQSTLTVCDYKIHTRGTFENNAYQDSGDISNMIRCYGYDGNSTAHYQIVHESDPRYTGNPDFAIWGAWEYHVLSLSGSGNMVHSAAGRLTGPV